MQPIVPPSLMFDVALPVPCVKAVPRSGSRLLNLPTRAILPLPALLDHPHAPLEIRVAWNTEGLAVQVRVRCRDQPVEGSSQGKIRGDHLLLFVDTRWSDQNHRANRFCSGFSVVPVDTSSNGAATIAVREIAQQRETRQATDPRRCVLNTILHRDGYETEIWLPESQLHGFREIVEIGQLGFSCLVEDSQHGTLHCSVGGDFPVTMDPSTWLRLELKQ